MSTVTMLPFRTTTRATTRILGNDATLRYSSRSIARAGGEIFRRSFITTTPLRKAKKASLPKSSREARSPSAETQPVKSDSIKPHPIKSNPLYRTAQDENLENKSQSPNTSPAPLQSLPPSGDGRQALPDLVNQRRVPLVGLLIAAGCLSAYAAYLITVFLKAPPPCSNPNCASTHHQSSIDSTTSSFTETATPTGLPASLTRVTANEFDASLDWPEWLMGYTRHRRRLAASAEGHVLEVAVGTGRNFDFYDWDDLVDDLDPTRRALRHMEKARFRGRKANDVEGQCSPEIISFTGVDISGDVLEVSRNKVRSVLPAAKEKIKKRRRAAWGTGPEDEEGRVTILDAYDGRVRLLKSDAQTQALPPPPPISSAQAPPPPAYLAAQAAAAAKAGKPVSPPQASQPSTDGRDPTKYDTILQSFGLCSVADPSAHLRNLAGALRPGTGRMLLMEHGRGRWEFVNRFLDQYAGRHFERFGCWWNRDVEAVVRDAAATVPGLEVVSVQRPGVLQGGTLMLIELKMNRVSDVEKVEASVKAAEEKVKGWFGFGAPAKSG